MKFEGKRRPYVAYGIPRIRIADGDTLLNAGAALFVNCGINELQMARFASDERLTFNDIKRYTGSILDLADKRKPIRRNPLITRTLYYSKDMEGFATGLKRISEACGKARLKATLRKTFRVTVRIWPLRNTRLIHMKLWLIMGMMLQEKMIIQKRS